MYTTTLRKVGGSVMLAVLPALPDILHLQPGAKVAIAVESGRLIVEPHDSDVKAARGIGHAGVMHHAPTRDIRFSRALCAVPTERLRYSRGVFVLDLLRSVI